MNISPIQNTKMALSAVWTNRFRSLLTILGIVIGITTVVSVASLLTGLRKGIVVFFEELGPDNVFINRYSGSPDSNGSEKERKRRPIRIEYASMLANQASTLMDVGLSMFIPNVSNGRPVTAKVPGFETDSLNINASTPNNASLAPRDFEAGRYFTQEEDNRAAHVVVVGHDLANALYPDGRAVGNTLMLDGAEYTVVGVFAKAKGGFFGQSPQDTVITMPFHTGQSRYPNVDRIQITCKAKPGLRKDAYAEVQGIMRRIRRLPGTTPDDFTLATPDQIIQQFDNITGLIGLVAIAISALGLLVGGIGVMNIMLVSVTERTQEIGVRMAVGARQADILRQFLIEAVLVCLIGGAMGVALALLAGLVFNSLDVGIHMVFSMASIVGAFAVSSSIGIVFGFVPARNAARLDPVNALARE